MTYTKKSPDAAATALGGKGITLTEWHGLNKQTPSEQGAGLTRAERRQLAALARRGGVGQLLHDAFRICTEDALWKADDAAWFAQYRHRAHRVRPAWPDEFKGERERFGFLLWACVRQVAPGDRLRIGLWLVVDTPVPDADEAFAHALFDLAVQRRPLYRRDVVALWERYRSPQVGGRHD